MFRDFIEIFAPVVRMETVRTVFALASQLELSVYQLDVKSAFLNGEIEEEVYIEQPKGYIIEGKEIKSIDSAKPVSATSNESECAPSPAFPITSLSHNLFRSFLINEAAEHQARNGCDLLLVIINTKVIDAHDLCAASTMYSILLSLCETVVLLRWGKRCKNGHDSDSTNSYRILELFRSAAACGSAAAMVDAGLMCREIGNRDKAREMSRKAPLFDTLNLCST
uniref:Reverse transcriptase Ty1/copia-type domain-containing protein n=1 Tax=Ananas comosus var. bracteatus TaxID=296719 RepID=A0A6V7Q238_ANACO|nr:unnamed protein product [Ananas comosus var. bracteatus]